MKENKEYNFLENIIRFFIDNYRITYLIIVAIIIFGVFAIYSIPKESSPEVNIPVAVIITPVPGAGAKNVEELVTKNIENQIVNISGVDKIDSTSKQGLSTIIVQFDSSVKGEEKISEIRNQVERARSKFPRDTGDSTIQKISFSDVPFMRISVSGPYNPSELKIYAEELKEEIEKIKNISDVIITGAPEREIKISFKEEKMLLYGLSPEFVSSVITRESIDFPIGIIKIDNTNYSFRVDNRFFSVDEIKNFPIIEKNGSFIVLEDLASIEEKYNNLDSITRFSIDGNNPEITVSLQLFKESGKGDILTIDKEVKKIFENLKSNYLPEDVRVDIIQNDANIIREDLDMLLKSIFSTIVIIFIILALLLGFRDSFTASIAVPFSFLITFLVIDLVGITINFLTLFSLVLSLGILVDASIVVVESIFEKRYKGLSAKDSAIETIKEFGAPLIAGTLTTVFVFFPMLLVSGVMGEFLKTIPITVSTVLLSSLFVSLILIPTIVSRSSKNISNNPDAGLFGLGEKLDKTISIYKNYLSKILINKKKAKYFLIGIFILFVITLSFPFVGILLINMFPSPDSDDIFINIEMPIGTSIDLTNEKIETIEEYLLKDKNVKSFFTFVGQSARAGSVSLSQGSNSNIGSISVSLKEKDRPKSTEIVKEYKELFSKIEGTDIRINQTEAGPGQTGAIQINVIGKNLEDLEKTAINLSGILSSIKGVENVDSGVELSLGELVISFKKELLRVYGVSAIEIADRLRTVISGKNISTVNLFDNDIEVVISSNLREKEEVIGNVPNINVSDIYALPIQTSRGIISLGTFIDINILPAKGSINRKDGERIISITSDVSSDYNSSKIISEFQEKIKEENLPSEVEITYGGEVDEINKSFRELFYSMIIGVLMIFVLMVLQFKSYKQSFFILTTIPLALIGVILGLAIVRQPLSFPAFIGVVALSGIVVNNAIILIDTINKRHKDKENLLDSIINGAESRFRPIILTTLTTVFGLIPLIFVGPVWAPVAYSIIFGLIFSTVLTLFVIPILYYLFSKEKEF